MSALAGPLIPAIAVWVGWLLSDLRPETLTFADGWPSMLVAAYWTAVDFRWLVTILCVPFLIYGIVRAAESGQKVQKDPTRMFTSAQRAEGFARAGNTCELESFPFIRCRRSASHGDHFFPWSLGGASTMANFVAACRQCNLAKSNKYPSPFLRWRVERRRRSYFPPGVPTTAGDRMHARR